MTETYCGSGKNQIAHAVSLDTNHANAFVPAGSRSTGHSSTTAGGEVHDVFIVISEGSDGEHVARTVYAASQDDLRQAHQANYVDEAIVAVYQ